MSQRNMPNMVLDRLFSFVWNIAQAKIKVNLHWWKRA